MNSTFTVILLFSLSLLPPATESSGSSSQCLSGSGSSGSDSGCVSSHLPEALSEDPSSPCQPPSSSTLSCYSPSVASPVDDKPRFNSQYISAVSTKPNTDSAQSFMSTSFLPSFLIYSHMLCQLLPLYCSQELSMSCLLVEVFSCLL